MRILPALVLTTILAWPAAAQTADSASGAVVPARTATTTPTLEPGEMVRVWAARARLDGAIASFLRLDSSLVITGQAPNPEAAPRQWAVPVDAIDRLEVMRRGKRSKTRIMTGVVIGALVGAAVGAPLGPYIECGGACDREGDLKPMVGYGLGAAIGAPIGALLGGVVAGISRPRWEPVTLIVR